MAYLGARGVDDTKNMLNEKKSVCIGAENKNMLTIKHNTYILRF